MQNQQKYNKNAQSHWTNAQKHAKIAQNHKQNTKSSENARTGGRTETEQNDA